jgi:L-ascorbate metabolism protein UlaG (beta-lactamase superfamily)
MQRPEKFDEAAWRKKIENQNVSDLYAPNFQGGRYVNPWAPMEKKSIVQLLKWRLSRKDPYTKEEKAYLPDVMPGLIQRIQSMPTGDFIAWIGHSTFLIRLQGQYWLTDPMLSERALLPKRITPPAMTLQELKNLGAGVNVLISNNHYDHLDENSIKSLPRGSTIFVPEGLFAFVRSIHDGEVVELRWWDKRHAGGTELTCLPAQHWSRRIGQPFNSTLWVSYMLAGSESTVYYGADSGYFIGYKEIGRLFPGIDYALLSTTAYHPRWFMHYAHKNIPETIDAFNDLGAKYCIPTQWGTFALGDEPAGYPALDLKRHIADNQLDPSRFIVMNIGQIVMMR